MTTTSKTHLEELWWRGVEAVRGFAAVSTALNSQNASQPGLIIAVGKAAGDMALGARTQFHDAVPTCVVTKYGHVGDDLKALPNCEIFEAAHPIPDANSLAAGAHLLKLVARQPSDASLLLLVSGGASSLVEDLRAGVTLDDLTAFNKSAMAKGLSIGEINAKRKSMSTVKAGQLLAAFTGASAQVIAISDVEGDSIDVIASGIGAYHEEDGRVQITIAASNAVAREAVARGAKELPVIANEERLYGDVDDVSDRIMGKIGSGPSGLYIFGGEPTVKLPKQAGRGGRNQHLALLLAVQIKGRNDLTILVAGTDGTDGPTDEAGAIIDGNTIAANDDIQSYLERADAGTYLDKRQALLTTGPTGTNVMDLVLALKE